MPERTHIHRPVPALVVPGRADPRGCRGVPVATCLGFTFLELLLVIVVLGILVGLVMPTLLRDEAGRVLQRSVDQALAVMMLQEEEAVLSGTQKGLLLVRQGDGDAGEALLYRWYDWVAGEERWVPADVPPRFNGTFEAVSEIVLTIEGQEVTIPDEAQDSRPQIVIFASGEATEFELRLGAAGADDAVFEWLLAGGYDGLKLEGTGDGEQ